MRTLVDIPERQLEALAEIGARRKLSRAAIIREAIEACLEHQRHEERKDAFGLWGQSRIDGLAYQKKIRGEW
ncbi:MAG TPA: CopG family transcriptional regulator [Geminicoccaceae bacterium]|nr:CopG family transcriptional regulator [Geminicoccaceae bacterium]